MEITDLATAAKKLGMAEREISSVSLDECEHGPVVHMADGSSYIDIVEADAKGQTGLAYFKSPHASYGGPFPIFADSASINAEEAETPEVAAPEGASAPAAPAEPQVAPPADDGSPVPVKGQEPAPAAGA